MKSIREGDAMAQAKTDNMDFFEKVGYVFSLWNESLKAFQLNLWTFIAIYLMPVAIFSILLGFYLGPIIADANNMDALTTGSVVLAVLATLFAAFILLLLFPAQIVTQIESVKGNKISTSEALKQGLKYLGTYLLAVIIAGAIITVPLFVSLLLLTVLIGIFLLPFAFAWAIVASFFFILVPYIIVTEKVSATDSLRLSVEITKRKWQWVLAVFIVTTLVSIISSIPLIGYVLGFVLSIIFLCLPALIYVRHIIDTPIEKKPKRIAKKSIKKTKTKAK